MKILREKVKVLVEDELKMANEEFPLFRSDHEAYGVLDEELNEAMDAAHEAVHAFGDFRYAVFNDDEDMKKDAIDKIRKSAIETACEFVQVAAMARKWKISQTDDFPQEHADALADNMTPEEVKKFCCETPSFLKKDGTITIANGKMKLTIKTKGEKDAE